MNTSAIHQTIDYYVNQLSPEYLNIAAELLAYLADRESTEATRELSDIPGFIESFERGRKDIAAGRLTPISQLRRKYSVSLSEEAKGCNSPLRPEINRPASAYNN